MILSFSKLPEVTMSFKVLVKMLEIVGELVDLLVSKLNYTLAVLLLCAACLVQQIMDTYEGQTISELALYQVLNIVIKV